MRSSKLSILVGVAFYLSIGCSSIDSDRSHMGGELERSSKYSDQSYFHKHFNPLYRIGDPDYWLIGEPDVKN